MKNEYGSQPIEPPPSTCTACGMPGISVPFAAQSAIPRTMLSVASVTMNGCGIRPKTKTTRSPRRPRRRRKDREDHERRRVHVHEDDRADHRRERDRRADGEVDPARDDHEQLAEREHRDHRRLREDVADVPAGEEDRRRQAHADHEEEQDQRRPETEREQPEPERAEAQRRRRRASCGARRASHERQARRTTGSWLIHSGCSDPPSRGAPAATRRRRRGRRTRRATRAGSRCCSRARSEPGSGRSTTTPDRRSARAGGRRTRRRGRPACRSTATKSNIDTCWAYSQKPTPPACGQTGTPNFAASSSTASTSLTPPSRQQSSWQTSIAPSCSSCLKTHAVLDVLARRDANRCDGVADARWPRTSSGLVGSSIQHGSTSAGARIGLDRLLDPPRLVGVEREQMPGPDRSRTIRARRRSRVEVAADLQLQMREAGVERLARPLRERLLGIAEPAGRGRVRGEALGEQSRSRSACVAALRRRSSSASSGVSASSM